MCSYFCLTRSLLETNCWTSLLEMGSSDGQQFQPFKFCSSTSATQSLCRSFKRFLKRNNPKNLRHFSLLKEHRFCLAAFFWRLLSCSLPPTLSTFGFWTQWWFQGWNSQGDIKCFFFFFKSLDQSVSCGPSKKTTMEDKVCEKITHL